MFGIGKNREEKKTACCCGAQPEGSGTHGAADVKATVAFAPDGTSRWNLRCSAKSAKYAKFDTRFPIVRRVVKDGEADWLMPSHDLGARLVEKAAYDKRPSRDGH